VAKKSKQLTVEEINEIRMSPDGIEKLAKRYGIGNTRMFAIKRAATLDEALKYATGMPKEPKPPQDTGKPGGQAITIEQPSKGAVVFTFGQTIVPLNPQHIYDAYLYYDDLRMRQNIPEEFSLAIKIAMKYVWERLHQPEKEKATIKIEGE
jgi:hypothetical protein